MRKQYLFVIFFAVMISSNAWSQVTPQINSTTPDPNEIGVSPATNISIVFSASMDAGTMNSSTVVVYGSLTGYHPGQFSYHSLLRILTFNPDIDFAMGEVLTVSITTGVESSLGVPLSRNHAFNFTIGAVEGSGAFDVANPYLGNDAKPWEIHAVDFDGDSHIDLVTRKYTAFVPGITIWTNNGTGAFAGDHHGTNDENDQLLNIQPVDCDRDSDIDIMVEFLDWSDGDFEYALIESPFGEEISPQTCIFKEGLTSNFELADFNGDGYQDLVDTFYWAADAQFYIRVFINSGTGYFSQSWQEQLSAKPNEVCTGDFNNDGSIDFATLSEDDVYVTVWLNDGEGSFAWTNQHWPGQDPFKIFSADLDGDGFVDIITVNRESDTISVMLNNGSAGFINRTSYEVGDVPNSLVAADLDGDGDLDLATSNSGSIDVSVLLNNGEGDFSAPRTDYPSGNENRRPRGIVAADFDGDGAIDLVTANGGYYSSAIYILLNQLSLVAVPDPVPIPAATMLQSNFPNPFNPQTTISFSLKRTEWAKIGVYDLGGRLLSILVDNVYEAGNHSVVWNGKDTAGLAMPSGSYVVRLATESRVEVRKVSLIR